jgi:hypothetical protein
MPDLSANVVQAAHRILVGDDDLRDRLPYADIGLFLATCNDTFPPASSIENEDDHLLVHAVKAALMAVERAAIWKTNPTASNVTVEPLSERNFRLMISAFKDILDKLIVFDKDYRQQVAHQHGGIAKHASMNDLMANAIDVEAQKFNFEQIANIHVI